MHYTFGTHPLPMEVLRPFKSRPPLPSARRPLLDAKVAQTVHTFTNGVDIVAGFTNVEIVNP